MAGTGEVLAKVEECWAAALDPKVGVYRAGHRLGADGGVAVIVQELVDARAAGVMFTQHPETGDRSLVVIESSFGLGEAVVGGDVVPDLFEVNKITRQLHRSRLGSKHSEHRLLPRRARRSGRPRRPGTPEWAVGTAASTHGEEALFALQVRPITVKPRRPAAAGPHQDAIGHIPGRLAGRWP